MILNSKSFSTVPTVPIAFSNSSYTVPTKHQAETKTVLCSNSYLIKMRSRITDSAATPLGDVSLDLGYTTRRKRAAKERALW